MARRKPGPSAAEVADADRVPDWVRRVGYGAIIHDIGRGTSAITDLHAEHVRRLDAARRWCEERGLSFCMTVHGWHIPSPQEAAAGLTKGPAELNASVVTEGRSDV